MVSVSLVIDERLGNRIRKNPEKKMIEVVEKEINPNLTIKLINISKYLVKN